MWSCMKLGLVTTYLKHYNHERSNEEKVEQDSCWGWGSSKTKSK